MHESGGGGQSEASVTPKRANSTSAIWWFDKACLSAGLARETRRDRGCGCRVLGAGGRSGGGGGGGARTAQHPPAAAHVAERAAGSGARAGRQGRRQHTGSQSRTHPQHHADTTPALEERHCALSQPSLKRAQLTPPAMNSIPRR
ncbi:hypothetical protein O0L34_g3963 [Tuta absoluta]|nr:hypothetical protein O0L34_g3963 [Tuta absoluta]